MRRDAPSQPAAPAAPGPRVTHADGWSNVQTGLGTYCRDKRISTNFSADLLDQIELEEIYRGNDLAATIVDTVPDEASRRGFDVSIPDDKDTALAVMAALGESADDAISEKGRLCALRDVVHAMKWQRGYGGAGIILGVDDGQDPSMPLDETRIRSFDWMTVMSPIELQPVAWQTDANAQGYGEPELYRVVPLVVNAGFLVDQSARQFLGMGRMSYVHASRVIAFPGIKVSRRIAISGWNYGWGDSLLNRVWRVLRDFDMSWDSAAHLIADFAQAVLKMKGLFDLVTSNDPGDENAIIKRAQLIDMTRSVARMVLIDQDEDFERKPTPIAGLPDLLDRFCNRLSAASRIPVTILMGQSPAGLNATGNNDVRRFYDDVQVARERVMFPGLTRIARLKMLAKNGPTGGQLPQNWSISAASLWQLDEVQQADVRLKTAQADEIEITAGVVTPEEVASSRHGGDTWSTQTVLNKALRDSMAKGLDVAGDVDPNEAPEADPALADKNSVNPKAALTGPQVLAMMQIVQAVASGEIPRESGVEIIAQSFPVDVAAAEKIIGNAGAGFEPKAKPTPPNPFAPHPPAPAAGAEPHETAPAEDEPTPTPPAKLPPPPATKRGKKKPPPGEDPKP